MEISLDFGGKFVKLCSWNFEKPIEDLETLLLLKNDKNFIYVGDKYFRNWLCSTRFIKLNNLTNHIGGAQICQR